MATVCHGPEFTTSGGVLRPAPAGVFRQVARLYKNAVNDGPYGNTPSPGRTHVDLETSWVNTTGVPQYVQVEAERGPWTIIVATPNQALFKDRVTAAVGVNARAVDPVAPSDEYVGSFYYNFFDSANSYYTQDRSRVLHPPLPICQPGETVSGRYRVTFETFAWRATNGDSGIYQAHARFAYLRIYAAPARGV